MQNRFTSAGQIEENIQGGLVVELSSILGQEPEKKVVREETDPAKKAALRRLFGPLTHHLSKWIPDRLLCIRFNVPNPFSEYVCIPNDINIPICVLLSIIKMR